MQIQLNGETTTIADNSTTADLIKQLDLTGKRLAVEVNREIVPRSTFESHLLQAGDSVEIVHAIGGGSAPQNDSTH